MALIIQSWLWLLSFIDTSGFCFRTCLIDGNELYMCRIRIIQAILESPRAIADARICQKIG
jgi:hypothetical protein